MSNLKKILALVLALVMSFSLVSVSSAAFKDEADITDVYAESADVLAALGVFKGYEDGSFNPKGSITRAEVAAIIYRIATGDVTDKQVGIYADYNVFSDVKAGSWYAGYVNYCANAKYVNPLGMGDGTFRPNETVTGYQALAMILRAVGYDKNGEFSGSAWQVETAKVGNQLGITRNVSAVTLGTAATREVVAEILFRAINVPTVTYTLALGYNQYDNIVIKTDAHLNATLGQLNFGLEQRVGKLTGFTYETGAIELDGVAKNIINVPAGIEDIGYEGYVYTVPTAGKKTETAVSDFYKIGAELLNSTDGTTYAYLTTYKVAVDEANVEYYINGYTAEDYWKTLNPGAALFNTSFAKQLVEELVAQVGVKVSFIDNDNGGKAEIVSVVHYTPAQITGITNDYNTGVNAVQAKSFYFDGTAIKAADVVTTDDLAYLDWTTYVEYRGNYYVDEVDYVTGKFEHIGRLTVKDSDNYNAVYTVGGAAYYTADDYSINGKDALVKGNLLRTIVLGLDPYGHVLTSYRYADPAAYLFVIANEQTKVLTGLTETMVAFSDGTIKTINVTNVDLTSTFQASGESTAYAAIAPHIYTYVVDEDGNYALSSLNPDCAEQEEFDYTAGLAQFGTLGLNSKSVVVDLRAGYAGKVYVGHTGENAVPGLNDATVHYVANIDGIVALAFLVDGVNSSDLSDSFVVFNTEWTDVKRVSASKYLYYIDVLVDGVLVEDYELSQAEYNYVETYGVGFYTFSKTGALTFEAFTENWVDAVWGNNTLVLDVDGDNAKEYYAYGDIPFQVINVGKGTSTSYLMALGQDGTTVKVIPVWNAYKTKVIEMYVIADPSNTLTAGTAGSHVAYQTKKVGGVATDFTYIVKDYCITTHALVANMDLDTALAVAMDRVNAAKAAYDAAVIALENAGIELMAVNTDAVVAAIAALEAAKAELVAALEALAEIVAATENVPAATLSAIAAMSTDAEAIIAKVDEVLTIAADDVLDELLANLDYTYTLEADATFDADVVAEYLRVYAIEADAEIMNAAKAYFNIYKNADDVEVEVYISGYTPDAGEVETWSFYVRFWYNNEKTDWSDANEFKVVAKRAPLAQ